MRGTFVLMRCLLSAAFVILAASFSSTPKPAPYEAPEGLVLVRDSYQLENANHPMIGFTPDSPGPHKLIVVLTGVNQPLDDKSFAIRRGALEKAVAVQGHGMVIVETPGFDLYPDFAGAAEFFASNLSGAREVMCADWVQKGTGVIAGIHKLCARDDFDCSSGIALHGGSMGAGIAVQTSKLLTTPTVNALLTTQWAPLLGGGASLPIDQLRWRLLPAPPAPPRASLVRLRRHGYRPAQLVDLCAIGEVPARLVHLRGQDQAAIVDLGPRLLWQPDRGPCCDRPALLPAARLLWLL